MLWVSEAALRRLKKTVGCGLSVNTRWYISRWKGPCIYQVSVFWTYSSSLSTSGWVPWGQWLIMDCRSGMTTRDPRILINSCSRVLTEKGRGWVSNLVASASRIAAAMVTCSEVYFQPDKHESLRTTDWCKSDEWIYVYSADHSHYLCLSVQQG